MSTANHIWIIDDDESIRWVLERALQRAHIDCTSFGSADEALGALGVDAPDAIVTDIRMPGTDGLALLGKLRADHPQTPVIIMTAHSDLDSAVAAYEGGAFEYFLFQQLNGSHKVSLLMYKNQNGKVFRSDI